MGQLIVHAGIPKAGSSTIQDWLARHAAELRARGSEVAVVRSRLLPGEEHEQLVLEPYASGGVNSGAFVTVYVGFDRDRGVLDALFEQLRAFLDRFPTVVLSSEGFAQLFGVGRGDAAFLARLEALAGANTVRVAYYARPQHTCLEAAWRQWGFRLSAPPSVYLAERAEQLHYLRTKDAVASAAPRVSFELRAFRSDLLQGGGPVSDFAAHFLGAADLAGDEPDRRVNPGLPIELVNALRVGPPELLGRDVFDNRVLSRLQELLHDVVVPESARVRRSRAVLQAYSYEQFAAENRELAQSEGWTGNELVPRPDLSEWGSDGWDLAELDELWLPEASAGELALLYRSLSGAIS